MIGPCSGKEIEDANDFSMADEGGAIAGHFDLAEKVGVEEDTGPFLTQIVDHIPHQAASHRVKTGCRLVEEDRARGG